MLIQMMVHVSQFLRVVLDLAYNYNDYDGDGLSNELVDDLSVDVNTHNLSLCEYEGCTNFSAINYDDLVVFCAK